jgi:predicted 2-oxoglutarate/Fe(II)-dependent dioxygenase YbiX/peroxiredoxin
MPEYRQLNVGEPAPWFEQRCTSNPRYVFDSVAGRYIVLCFFGTAADATGQAALGFAQAHRELFDDERMAFFGVSLDPEDERSGRVAPALPGIRHFWDFDGKASRLYGCLPHQAADPDQTGRRLWIVLDPGLNVLANIPFEPGGTEQPALLALLQGLPPVSRYAGVEMHAPVLIAPNVLEPALCAELIAAHRRHGGESSGFMRDVDGKTVSADDPSHKRRHDFLIEDPALLALLQQRIQQKIRPLVLRVHAMEITRVERYLVGCYDAQRGGHFRPHRDNTTLGTAHRRFALSVNLNDDFDGGDLCFPEYGPRGYKLPAGSAIVFSGSLLHAVQPVRRGARYAFLPFLYDEQAAALRDANLRFLEQGLPGAGSVTPA